jgi:hypothetical protein
MREDRPVTLGHLSADTDRESGYADVLLPMVVDARDVATLRSGSRDPRLPGERTVTARDRAKSDVG